MTEVRKEFLATTGVVRTFLVGWLVGFVSRSRAESLDHSLGSCSEMLASDCWENCVNRKTNVKDLLQLIQ